MLVLLGKQAVFVLNVGEQLLLFRALDFCFEIMFLIVGHKHVGLDREFLRDDDIVIQQLVCLFFNFFIL